MFDNSALVKLHKMGLVMCHWIKNATRRKKEACPKCQKRKVQKMLALPRGMERLTHELNAQRDRLVRLHSVQTDLALDLPISIPLPDGEELPYGSGTRLQIRTPEQQSEIYQKCIRPPPNKTIFDGKSPPSHRPNSAGAATSNWPGQSSRRNAAVRSHNATGQPTKKSSDLLERTVRCFGGKRSHSHNVEPPKTAPPPASLPVVIVPSHRSRKLAAFSERAGTNLASVPTVSCVVPVASVSNNDRRQQIREPCPPERFGSHSSESSSDENTADTEEEKLERNIA